MKEKKTERMDFNYEDDVLRKMDTKQLQYLIGMGITGEKRKVVMETLAKRKSIFKEISDKNVE